ncbi:uncharacterized protein LOC133929605 [Phragmites australis]|uniref:uncharacterized protein LOC133929605 n=1 Tax=Phragmites australis TaxID=29695 RepID=UPI002D777E53|nr:uncharacterized protein LOC133929605 [Phragmites australis]
MAELASGAVSSLLGVIRNETRLLGGVRSDVQFIKEEMESMNSFLLHLARTVPPRGEHDEQVRTWMNQVRLLAQDCNNCIDLYLYRGNPEIHLAKDGLRRYLLWVPWFLQKMVAQHRAAIQLRELKERARDVGERRLRYGVEVPAKASAGQSSPGTGLTAAATPLSSVQAAAAPAAAGGEAAADYEDEDDDHQLVVATANHHSGPRGALFGLRVLEDYVNEKLAYLIANTGSVMQSIAIMAPDAEDARALAREALAVAKTHFRRSVLVDIPAVHFSFLPLKPEDILYYILRELERAKSGQGEEEKLQSNDWQAKQEIRWKRWVLIDEILENIEEMKVDDKIETIKSAIPKVKVVQLKQDVEKMKDLKLGKKTLGELLVLLMLKSPDAAAAAAAKQEALYDIIQETANKLQETMEEEEAGAKQQAPRQEEGEEAGAKQQAPRQEEGEEAGAKKEAAPIRLHDAQYEHILREVFQTTSNSKPLQDQEQDTKRATETTATTSTTRLGDDQIKEIIDKVKLEILREVLPTTSNSKPLQTQEEDTPTGFLDEVPRNPIIEETIKKIKKIRKKIKEQLVIKGILDKINKDHLNQGRTLIILKTDEDYAMEWEKTRNVLSLLCGVAGAAIVTASQNTQQAKEYCYPSREPLDCSLVGFYHDIVLQLTGNQMHEDNSQIYHAILDDCKPHEFCMKIFAHALYANRKMSKEELRKLHSTLKEVSLKSLGSIAKKMFKFSYNNLPKEYKSCLLYLAIFRPGHKIRRSTLIGRWIVEGLITTDDWRWSSSVRKAERCFDALINRWLVYPADIGATGKAKSCIVGDLVHEFITKIAKKQRTVETRLSDHLAHHFSIFNDLHLRASDTIHTFFTHILRSSHSQVSQLKVLDLEGCCFFEKNRHSLKHICSKILLLKYLSLRGTDVTQLPREINNLRELEVLDIRQTKVPAFATRNVMLLKLKRLLAGHIDPAIGDEEFSGVCIPEKIEKMVNMEVLSNVKAPTSQDLKDITNLWQLRKLGVVIHDKKSHFSNLFQTISDLHQCLMSLSITISTTKFKGASSSRKSQGDMHFALKRSPKLLESLSISGTTKKVALLPLLAKDDGGNQLNKVTLTRTMLNQADLQVLAKLPKLCCVRLQHIECTERNLTFKKDEFPNLKYFLVEGSNLTEIAFEIKAAPELEKIVLSLTDNLESLSGVKSLPKLEELELKNNSRLLSFFDKAKQITKVTLWDTFLWQGELQILAKKPNMRCLELLDNSYVESKLTFKEGEFPKLNLLIVDCSAITNISFTDGSAPMLKKIAWSFTNMDMESLSGIHNLPRLKELELIGDRVPNEVTEEIKKLKDRYHFKPKEPENQDQAIGNAHDARFPLFCWKKNKV